MENLKIEAGKRYRTRAGKEVRIYATDGKGKHPVHGAVHDGEPCYSGQEIGWQQEAWFADGSYFEDKEAMHDIVEEIK